jgi:hypothetical protein
MGAVPGGSRPPWTAASVRRRDRLGGSVHEYYQSRHDVRPSEPNERVGLCSLARFDASFMWRAPARGFWSDGGPDFPRLSLRPTPGREGRSGTGGDAK